MSVTGTSSQIVQVFFFDGTAMQRVQFTNGQWTAGDVSSSMPEASISNGPMGVVGLNDTAVRMYYLSTGRKIVEVLPDGTSVWKVGATWSDEYD
jgi:hypothetical protein